NRKYCSAAFPGCRSWGLFSPQSLSLPNSTELERSVNPQTGISALQASAPDHMSENLPFLYLPRHAETAWSITAQRTGLTDLPLTERGARNAQRLGKRLAGIAFAKVFTSPLKRAARTCELAGFGAKAEADPNLVEWSYGDYEGLRTAEMHVS